MEDILSKVWKNAVVKLNLDGDLLGIYINAKEGAKSVQRDNSYILKCCKNNGKTYKGYKWMYHKNYNRLG